jgi:hypothetical protein
MGVVCCQVEVSATSWSLVQEESHRLWRVVVCGQETSCDEEAIAPRWAAEPQEINNNNNNNNNNGPVTSESTVEFVETVDRQSLIGHKSKHYPLFSRLQGSAMMYFL